MTSVLKVDQVEGASGTTLKLQEQTIQIQDTSSNNMISAGDYLEVYMRQQSGGSLDASGDTNDQTTYFGGFKLIE